MKLRRTHRMTPKPTDPRYPQHGFATRKPYIVSDHISDEVWEECAQLAEDNGYVLFKISDADGEIVVLKEKMSTESVWKGDRILIRDLDGVMADVTAGEGRFPPNPNPRPKARGSFFALKPGERGKSGRVAE